MIEHKSSKSSMKSGGIVSALRNDIDYYACQLSRFIDSKSLLRAYQSTNRGERMDAYHPILRDACCACFRGTNIRDDAKRCTVWGFDGRKWVMLSVVVFCDAVGEAMKRSAGAGSFMVSRDWVALQPKFLESAYRGVCASPLGDNPSVVGFENGVWDFSDIYNPVRRDFSDMLPVTSLLPYDYDSSAGCPLWTSFLSTMLRPSDILKLQKYLGLGVVNRRLMSHVVEDTLWLIGAGANGKTTILNVVRGVYGCDKVSEASMRELLDRNQDARMRAINRIEGHVFNICGEMDMQDISRDSDSFKKLCSGEPHDARGIGKDIHTAYDIPFLIFSMNQRPSNRRMDAAFRRRIVEIVFSTSVKPEDMDASLGEKLRAELPGIRNWMIDGYRQLSSDGFMFDHTLDEDYQELNEQFFDIFVRHEGLRASAWAGHDDVAHFVAFNVLYDMYVEFCKRNMYGVEPPSEKSLAMDLKRLNFQSVRKASGKFYVVYCDSMKDYFVK